MKRSILALPSSKSTCYHSDMLQPSSIVPSTSVHDLKVLQAYMEVMVSICLYFSLQSPHHYLSYRTRKNNLSKRGS
jgi:hypothetical protein